MSALMHYALTVVLCLYAVVGGVALGFLLFSLFGDHDG